MGIEGCLMRLAFSTLGRGNKRVGGGGVEVVDSGFGKCGLFI